jgi:hypothetical protein
VSPLPRDGESVKSVLAIIIVASVCFFAVYAGIFTLPQANEKFLWFLLGALVTKFSGVFDFYFGSSRSAERAQDVIASAPPAAQPNVAEVTAEAGKAASSHRSTP